VDDIQPAGRADFRKGVRVKVEEMEAGEALDALIAEKIFKSVTVRARCGDGMTRTDEFDVSSMSEADAVIRKAYSKYKGKIWPAEYCGPEYSTEISEAWKVLEKLGKKYSFQIDNAGFDDETQGKYRVMIGWSDDPISVIADGETVSLAICRAGMKAVGA